MRELNILANRILDWVETEPGLDVLTFVDIDKGGNFVEETRTYQQLWDNAQRWATWLQARGMKKGDSFAIMMANHPEFVELMVASSILGTVFVPIDPRTKGHKLNYMVSFAKCKGIVVADYALAAVEAANKGNNDIWTVTVGAASNGYPRAKDILSKALPNPLLAVASTDPNAAMQILYTSGTTGDPKAILSSHARFASAAVLGDILGLTTDDRPYTGLSLTHVNAQVITLGNILTRGLRGVISRKFTKSRIWDIARHYSCTWFNLLGGMTTAIYAEAPKENDANNPVRIILSAGMPAAIWQDFSRRFGIKLNEFYGAAEGGLTLNPAGVGPMGSCGQVAPSMELKIFGEQGQECAPGEVGEICFRNIDGSAPDVKYYRNQEATEKKTVGGWLRMGDMGHVDENGWLFFHYRKGGAIRRNGDFIDPGFVEKALSQVNCIDDVFVYGVPAASGAPGEKDIVAAVVVTEAFDAEQVFSVVRKNLETNCVPSYLQVVGEIPKTASEKPQERILLDSFSIADENIYSAVSAASLA
mgnify:CR=1 FL=1